MAGAFQSVHLELHSDISVLDQVQHVAEDLGRQAGLDEETLHWTSMAVRESVINAITHGNNNHPDKRVFVDFSVTPTGDGKDFVVRVRDQGHGFDPAEVCDPLAPENLLNTSGRGIFLIRQFMDEVTVACGEEGGTEVRMVKHL
jgi:serine/threonine-protein kinase RsbW